MFVQQTDSVVRPVKTNYKLTKIDVNNDGVSDLQIESDFISSRKFNDNYFNIKCLTDDIYIATFKSIDIAYFYQTIDTSYWDGGMFIYKPEYISYYNEYDSDSIKSITENVYLSSNFGDSISIDGEWTNGYLNLNYVESYHDYDKEGRELGSATVLKDVIFSGKYSFFSDDTAYIGFKIIELEKPRLGWLKIVNQKKSDTVVEKIVIQN